MLYKRNIHTLEVYLEKRRKRVFVGTLTHSPEREEFLFTYDDDYRRSKTAIPIGPNFPLLKKNHLARGEIFPEFYDRIPSRENLLYPDYCRAQGISENETNPITLLTTIGRKGPSSFVFEPTFTKDSSSFVAFIRKTLKTVDISMHDLSGALGISSVTFSKIMTGKSKDDTTLNFLDIAFSTPQVALYLLQRTGPKLHDDVRIKLYEYFSAQVKATSDKTKVSFYQ